MEIWIQSLLLLVLGGLVVVGWANLSKQAEQITPSIAPPVRVDDRSTQVTRSKVVNDTALVDVHSVNPGILLDIRYATKNNFMHKQLYPKARCLLKAKVAAQLSQVQMNLEQQGLGLKVYDCYRPLSVQKQMWKTLPNDLYVANPTQGSRHNRGSAIDVTLVDRNGRELEMPTEFDDFSERAHTNYPGSTIRARKHRQQLKQAMERQGFVSLKTEWWHFDAKDWEQYPILDIPLDAIPDS
ncbi:M15 family metallopeptidase [Kovacikia minuta CCNUW1]|uniref:M15 family metallopeptidase n=1 Tax=Kovacikia minuta TaxID=2931930 RepID=UPI001CCCD672|nr:M15 family metallopeptidase [Kovacikia minuta]UBF27850.1 M15 family metallopeptidase [Kovacikia minuta CCNUW1]